ncbi:hypothetical protein J3R83DRAFT_3029 [Lanmaoa asiatica]|nr:hypothetical protein J3R83DRAFT_3029 [Lanmaoa asiatica]
MDSPVNVLLDAIRRTPFNTLMDSISIEIKDRLPHKFLEGLNDEDKLEALRPCIIISILTQGRVIPRVFQLEASLAMLHQR